MAGFLLGRISSLLVGTWCHQLDWLQLGSHDTECKFVCCLVSKRRGPKTLYKNMFTLESEV